MQWIRRIGRSRPRRSTVRRSGARRGDRTGQKRHAEPASSDRSYAAYVASWDELEWEPVWVFAPSPDRIAPGADEPAPRMTARRRSRRGLLWAGLGTVLAGLAIVALATAVTVPVAVGGGAAAVATAVWLDGRVASPGATRGGDDGGAAVERERA